MANYYSDHPEIGFYLNHPLMARIVELKEKGFADAKEYDYAPVDLGDAIENYKQILDITTWQPISSHLTRRALTWKVRTSRTDV